MVVRGLRDVAGPVPRLTSLSSPPGESVACRAFDPNAFEREETVSHFSSDDGVLPVFEAFMPRNLQPKSMSGKLAAAHASTCYFLDQHDEEHDQSNPYPVHLQS